MGLDRPSYWPPPGWPGGADRELKCQSFVTYAVCGSYLSSSLFNSRNPPSQEVVIAFIRGHGPLLMDREKSVIRKREKEPAIGVQPPISFQAGIDF